jgi:hypothetical protein
MVVEDFSEIRRSSRLLLPPFRVKLLVEVMFGWISISPKPDYIIYAKNYVKRDKGLKPRFRPTEPPDDQLLLASRPRSRQITLDRSLIDVR